MWALLWDRGNLALAERYGVSREEVDAMFALGEWTALPHRTRPEQVLLNGPTAPLPAGRLIACAAEVRDTSAGRRFRPVVAKPAASWHEAAWRERHRHREVP